MANVVGKMVVVVDVKLKFGFDELLQLSDDDE